MPRKPAKKRNKMKRYKPRKFTGVPSGMPLARRAHLRYSDSATLTSTLGAMGQHIFSANNADAPNFTGASHAPMGWDQWGLLFNHYVVVGSKIEVTLTSATSGTGFPTVFGIYLTDQTTPPYTSWTQYSEAKKGTHCFLNGNFSNTKKCTSRFSAKKFFNISDINDNVNRIGAATTAAPGDQALFNLWFQTLNGTTAAYSATVTIDYIIDFSEPRDLALST